MTIKNKLDHRQSRQRAALDQISNDTDLRLDTILNLINDELTPPLRLITNGLKTIFVNSESPQTKHYETNESGSGITSKGIGRKKITPSILNKIPYASCFITFPDLSGGFIISNNFPVGVTYNLNISDNNYKKIIISADREGKIQLFFGQESLLEATATFPNVGNDVFPIGYIVLRNIGSGVIENIQNNNIYQFSKDNTFIENKNVLRISHPTDHDFSVGDVVFYSNITNRYEKAKTDSLEQKVPGTGTDYFLVKNNIVGMVSNILSKKQFELTTHGVVEGITTQVLSSSNKYFLSSTTSGRLTTSNNNTFGSYDLELGTALSSNSFLFLPKLTTIPGDVVYSSNIRTKIMLEGSSSSSSYTFIQNFYYINDNLTVNNYPITHAQIVGWIFLDADTSYRFYIKMQISRDAQGSYHLGWLTTAGDTPPVGLNYYMRTDGRLLINTPALSGWKEGYFTYSLKTFNQNCTETGGPIAPVLPLPINYSNLDIPIKIIDSVPYGSSYTPTIDDYMIYIDEAVSSALAIRMDMYLNDDSINGRSFIIVSKSSYPVTIYYDGGNSHALEALILQKDEKIKLNSKYISGYGIVWFVEYINKITKTQTFYSNSVWTCPKYVTNITAYGCGGGGGGGGRRLSPSYSGGQGGGGAGLQCAILNTVPQRQYQMYIGNGGTGVSSGTGQDGYNSEILDLTDVIYIQRFSGGRGGRSIADPMLNGTAGAGIGGGSDTYNSAGGNGFASYGGSIGSPIAEVEVVGYLGGGGGGGYLGQAASGSTFINNGNGFDPYVSSPSGYGCGGGGGAYAFNPSTGDAWTASGGNGSKGLIILVWDEII